MRRRSRALFDMASACCAQLLACAEPQCASLSDAGLQPGAVEGDASVFAEITVEVGLSEWVTADAAGVVASAQTRVVINGGGEQGHVADLQIDADGTVLEEFGSAATPPNYAFQYTPSDPQPGQPVELRFRLQGSRFTLSLTPLRVELTAPTPGEELPADAPLQVRWRGVAVPPDELSLDVSRCPIEYEELARADHEATFGPRRKARDQMLPCTVMLRTSWSTEQELERVPFKALSLKRVSQRTRPFTLR